jgi:pSer/pThr/pTyr-binding forkhead associated (FHA) protein
MITLRHRDGHLAQLSPYCVAGRSPAAHVRLASSAASSEHAAFHLIDGAWYLRDLGSRNGTFVNGVPVQGRKRVALSHGDIICFGDAREEWRVEDLGAAPALEHPPLLETSALSPSAELARVALTLSMSPDGMDVFASFALDGGERVEPLGTRSGFRILYFLARARLEDRARGVSPAEEGWRPRSLLLEEFQMTKNRLAVEAHRMRQLFEQHGVRDASLLLEYRRASRTFRLGIARLTLEGAPP